MFYVSAFLEANRDEYYECLLAVSRDWTGWCWFFLRALKAQAEENQQKATAIIDLYERMKSEVVNLTHSQYAIRALDWVFGRPIFKSSDFVVSAGIPEPTAKRIVSALCQASVLRVLRCMNAMQGGLWRVVVRFMRHKLGRGAFVLHNLRGWRRGD